MSGLGLNPGDVVVVDIAETAVRSAGSGDAVLVQLIDPDDPFKGETHLRQLVEPYRFVTNSNDPDFDGAEDFHAGKQEVRIKGVVVRKLTTVKPANKL